MEVKICENQEEWDNWFFSQENGPRKAEFLQLWDWGEFQTNTGKPVIRLQIVENGEIIGQMQGFEYRLSFLGKYIYLPRVNFEEEGETRNSKLEIRDELVRFLKSRSYIFLRVESVFPVSSFQFPVSKTKNRQPQTTLILDLNRLEDEILAGMHPKTRYNIHLAEKHGVEVREEKNLEAFWQLNLETTGRDQFKSHDKKYYEKMFALPGCQVLIAYYRGKPIAGNIFIIFNGVITYLHGASGSDWRNLMAPYLLQWEGMKLGKKLGCKFYDFWGISPVVNDSDVKQHTCFNNFCWEVNHPWTGVTRFKVGFGGEVREYPQAVDIVLKKWHYTLYKLVRRMRN